MNRRRTRLSHDRKGATAVEYGLIVGLIVIALMVGVMALGGQTRSSWDGIETKVRTASKT